MPVSNFAQNRVTTAEINQIKNYLKKNAESSLRGLNDFIKWNNLSSGINEIIEGHLRRPVSNSEIIPVIKCFILQAVFAVSDHQLLHELNINTNFRSFITGKGFSEIPAAAALSKFREILIKEGEYKKLFNNFYSQLVEAEFIRARRIEDGNLQPKKNLIPKYSPQQKTPSEDKRRPIFDASKDRSYKMYYDTPLEISEAFIKILKSAGEDQESQIELGKNILRKKNREFPSAGSSKTDSTDENGIKDEWLRELDNIINNAEGVPLLSNQNSEIKGLENELNESLKTVSDDKSDELNKRIKEIEYRLHELIQNKEKAQTQGVSKEKENKKIEIEKKKKLLEKLQLIDEKLKGISEKKEALKNISIEEPYASEIQVLGETEYSSLENRNIIQPLDEEDVELFNESNLTEDYELGLRFYKMGLKTSFVNLRENPYNRDSMIATAEYFPNKFWPAIKQRSRWIAGISFQNWKLHKWEGSLKTKYFLMRDRKTIFSNLFVVLSNIVFAYFIFYMIDIAAGWNIASALVQKYTILWGLLMMSFIFMVNRLIHRFIFTYKWYGTKYAFMSLGRLLVDNVLNFFATIRAIKVFKQTKHKVVWDKTDHY